MSDLIKILEAASEFSLQEFICYLQSLLIENKSNWMKQNFNLIYQTSFKHDSFLELQKFCTDLISNEPELIFNSSDFTSISEKSLVSLIQNDKLQTSEIQVWDHVLKWGLAQNPEPPSDCTSFSIEDFKASKKTLQQCIPFVRFDNLTSKEFMDKVIPYKKILPKELYKDLLNTFFSLVDPNIKVSDKPKLQEIKGEGEKKEKRGRKRRRKAGKKKEEKKGKEKEAKKGKVKGKKEGKEEREERKDKEKKRREGKER